MLVEQIQSLKQNKCCAILFWYFFSLRRGGFAAAADPLVQHTATRLSARVRRKEGACGIGLSSLVCQTHICPQEEKTCSNTQASTPQFECTTAPMGCG